MKAKVFKAPEKIKNPDNWPSVFLAGAIDMGKAEDWQKELTETLSDVECVILNPRRNDWDSSWEQSIENKKFREQVEWELKGLEDVTFVAMGLTKDSKAPISLLELGLHVLGRRMLVFCPEGFYRKGNVDVVCHRYGIPVFDDFEDFKKNVKARMLETIAGKQQEEVLPAGTIQEQRNHYITASDRITHRMMAREFVLTRYRNAKTAVYRPIQMVKPWTDAYGVPAQELQQPLRRRPDYGEIESEIENRMNEENAMNKVVVAKELMAVVRELQAITFPNQQELEKYLKEHPRADKSKHKVEKDPSKESPDEVEERLKEKMGPAYKTQDERMREEKEKWDKMRKSPTNVPKKEAPAEKKPDTDDGDMDAKVEKMLQDEDGDHFETLVRSKTLSQDEADAIVKGLSSDDDREHSLAVELEDKAVRRHLQKDTKPAETKESKGPDSSDIDDMVDYWKESGRDTDDLEPLRKDDSRIVDIFTKAGGDVLGDKKLKGIDSSKVESLVKNMAKKITDPAKAFRRGLAMMSHVSNLNAEPALKEKLQTVSRIFFDRSKELMA